MKINEILIPDHLLQKTKDKILNAVKIDKETGCWVLQKYFHSNKKNGKFTYCKMSINNKGVRDSYFVHRLSYHVFVGNIPHGALILHKCHNYKCCAPEHLYPGDQKRNIQDCKDAGREKKAVGELNKKSKFKKEDIEKIFKLKQMDFSSYQIARLYKVAPITIRRILLKQSWKHLYKED